MYSGKQDTPMNIKSFVSWKISQPPLPFESLFQCRLEESCVLVNKRLLLISSFFCLGPFSFSDNVCPWLGSDCILFFEILSFFFFFTKPQFLFISFYSLSLKLFEKKHHNQKQNIFCNSTNKEASQKASFTFLTFLPGFLHFLFVCTFQFPKPRITPQTFEHNEQLTNGQKRRRGS
jgi:hypothetical protein